MTREDLEHACRNLAPELDVKLASELGERTGFMLFLLMTEGIEVLVAERDTLRAEVERLRLQVEQLSAIEVVPVPEVVDRLTAERDALRAEVERLRGGAEFVLLLDHYERDNLLWLLNQARSLGCDTGDWCGQIRFKLKPETGIGRPNQDTPNPTKVDAENDRLRAALAQPHMEWASGQHSVGVDIEAEDKRLRAEVERLREDNRKLSLLFKALGPDMEERDRITESVRLARMELHKGNDEECCVLLDALAASLGLP